MKYVPLGLLLVNSAMAVLLVPASALAVAAMRLQVMSSFEELRQVGAVSEERLSAVAGWTELPGTPPQKAERFLLAEAPEFFTRSAWLASAVFLANSVVLFALWRRQTPLRSHVAASVGVPDFTARTKAIFGNQTTHAVESLIKEREEGRW
jgi:preprotein translocase subunit SecG